MTKLDPTIKVRHEPMRIAGRHVDADGVVEVRYPWNDTVVGTVPAGGAEHARQAFAIAAAYKPKLTRYERQKILLRTAELLNSRKEEISDLITLELGISKQDSLYEVGRAFDVFTLSGQMCIQDDGQIFSCDLTPHGKARKIFTMREPLNAISAITPFNHPLNMVSHKKPIELSVTPEVGPDFVGAHLLLHCAYRWCDSDIKKTVRHCLLR